MGHELHELNVIRVTESEEDVQNSTALFDLPEREVPTTNDDTVSGGRRRIFDHPSGNNMEHDLHDLNIICATEGEDDVQDSTALLDPPEGELPSRNSDIFSGTYNASFDRCSEADIQFPTKRRNRSPRIFIRPIIACSWQFIVLVMLIVFIVRTESTTFPIVPRHLAMLYLKYPQGTATAITLIGSLLSVLSTKAFSEAIRFHTVVSLGSQDSKSMTLYSLYSRITVSSGNTMFDFTRGRIRWTSISLISFILFTVQTAAWTTLLTPRATDVSYQTSFQDFNYFDALVGPDLGFGFDLEWAPAWDSGYIAATEGTNMTQYLSLNGYVLNGTSRGIWPMMPTFDNWTRVEGIQQGLTAEVNCTVTSASDPNISIHRQTFAATGIEAISLCCNGGCNGSSATDSEVFFFEHGPFLAFTMCPISNTDNVITVYVNEGNDLQTVVGNQTCTIRPRWLNVSVTYVRDGFVTLEPMTQLTDIPLNSSTLIQSATSLLQSHLSNAQAMSQNNIVATITRLADQLFPDHDMRAAKKEVARKLMANYIRGVFEYGASSARYLNQPFGGVAPCDPGCNIVPLRSFPSTTYVHAIVWGQVPRYRLLITISPLAIMIVTINIVLASLYGARHLDLDYIALFNAMDTLHIIAACSSGNVHSVSFPDYGEDIGLFGKDVRVELPDIEAGNGAAGFHFSPL